MKPLKIFALSAVLVSMLSGHASASTITQSSFVDINNAITLVPSDEGISYLVASIGLSDIQKYDQSLGTLNSATISIVGNLDFFYEFTPIDVIDSVQSNSIDIEVEAGVGALVPTGVTVLSPSAFISDVFGCLGDPGNACMDISGNGGPVSPTNTFTGSDLTPFLGDGSPIDPFTTAGSLNDIKIGLIFSLVSLIEDNVYGTEVYMDGAFFGDATVTYDFTPTAVVPLPAAFWLFTSGLLGVMVPMIRKRG